MVLVKVQSSQGRLRLLLLVRHTSTRSTDCKLALLGRRSSIMNLRYPDLCPKNRGDNTARGLQRQDTLDVATVKAALGKEWGGLHVARYRDAPENVVLCFIAALHGANRSCFDL